MNRDARDRHPLIRFRTGAAGRREAVLVGGRLLVRQVMATVHGEDGDVDRAAAYLGVPRRAVLAAVAYFAEFRTELEEDARWAARIEADERSRWERERTALE